MLEESETETKKNTHDIVIQEIDLDWITY